MNSVATLAQLLALAPTEPLRDASGAAAEAALDLLIERLRSQVRQGRDWREPLDLQREAVQRFRQTGEVRSLREARLLCFGLGLPDEVSGSPCLLDDPSRLEALLKATDGWLDSPRHFRRCFQGLLWSYFNQAPQVDGGAPNRHRNWCRLRDYLNRRAPALVDRRSEPAWVQRVGAHPGLFGETPCADFSARLLEGDRSELEAMVAEFGIGESSWFLSDLIDAQLEQATQRDDAGFQAVLPAMLTLLAGGRHGRDAGLAMLLERHARTPRADLHAGLRDAVRQAWGFPWRPTDALRWDGLGDAARQLAGDWFKDELLDLFFGRIADGSGARRATFWKRYLPAITAIDFALGPEAAFERDRTSGLLTPWADGPHGELALVLTLGCARIVAWSDPVEPVWAYHLRHGAPFDMRRPVAATLDAPNALRQSRRELVLAHRDGVDGWRQWEQLFEAALKDRFGLGVGHARPADPRPFVDLSDAHGPDSATLDDAMPAPRWDSTSNGEDVHWQTAEAMSVPYSRPDLQVLARVHALQLHDEGGVGARAKVRVFGASIDRRIALVLARWGFEEVRAGEWLR